MRRAVIVLLSITAAFGVDKKPPFRVEPAASYPAHQSQDKVSVGIKPYNTDVLAATVFGKVKPHEHGILPVFVVIQNDTGKALRLDLRAELVLPGGRHLISIPAEDVIRYDAEPKHPGMPPQPRLPLPRSNKKGPLNSPEIEGRAFAVKMAPPGESVSGFFYFETSDVHDCSLYLTGVKDAATGRDYFYFEIPFDQK